MLIIEFSKMSLDLSTLFSFAINGLSELDDFILVITELSISQGITVPVAFRVYIE